MSIRVALVGPDGTGKSTVCQRLCAALPKARYLYMGSNLAASNVRLFTSWLCVEFSRGPASTGAPPAIAPQRPSGLRGVPGWFKTLLRVANLVAEEWYRHWVSVWYRWRGATVIMDRHFYFDFFAHDVAPRYERRHLACRVHGWLLKFYPLPDLVLVLDADVDELFRRKPEGTREQLVRRRQEYLDALNSCSRAVLVDARQPLDAVVHAALTAITEHQAGHAPERRIVPAPTVIKVRTEASGPAPAVVVGIDSYTGLQTARTLAARGIPVIGLAENPRHFACRSRACGQLRVAPLRSEDLITALEELADDLGRPAVLVPCVDLSVLLISRHRERLQRSFHFALPAAETVEALMDKASFHQFAESHGFRVPHTCVVRTREEALEAAQSIEYPCLLKPTLKTDRWERKIKSKVFKLTSAAELLRTYELCRVASPVMTVQTWVEGPDENLFTWHGYLDQQSQPLAALVSQKLRQWPPEIGVASLSQTCENQEVAEIAVQLFQAARFTGLAYLELKRDERTGEYVLIEANVGRQTGRSALAEGAGVELLQTMYCDLLKLPLPTARAQRPARCKWIYLRKDLQSAWYHWRRGQLSLAAWWRSVRGRKVSAVFSWRDPLPFLADFWNAVVKPRPTRRGELRSAPAASARPKAGVS